MLTREQYFPGQSEGEQVALFIRRHWMAFAPWAFTVVVLIMAAFLLSATLWFSSGDGQVFGITGREFRIGVVSFSSTMYLGLLFFFLRAWMSYYLDVTIVTERRLIDIEQEGVFGRQIAEQSLLRVQDVSARQKGFFQHLFNYGNLYIETAGEQPNFELHNIPRPNDVARTILNLHDRLVESGSHDTEMKVIEGYGHMSLPPQTNNPSSAQPHAHPLEELRPYFPEPSRPQAKTDQTLTKPTPEPKQQERQLADDETVILYDTRKK